VIRSEKDSAVEYELVLQYCKFNKVAIIIIIIIIIITYCSVQIQGCTVVNLTEGLHGYIQSFRVILEIKLVEWWIYFTYLVQRNSNKLLKKTLE
jgi:hypothetical protein